MKRFLPSLRRLVCQKNETRGGAMNCKPGDRAIFVSSTAGNKGKVVQCIRLATRADLSTVASNIDGAVWVIDRPVNIICGYVATAAVAHDHHLRPITPPAGTVSEAEVTELFKSDTAPMVTKEAA
jgi:hypothetical protein